MSISNSLAGLLTGNTKTPTKSVLDAPVGDQKGVTGEREIDAALAFAASLLDASGGNPVPESGNILPAESTGLDTTKQVRNLPALSSDEPLVTQAPPVANMRGDVRLTSWPPVALTNADTLLATPVTPVATAPESVSIPVAAALVKSPESAKEPTAEGAIGEPVVLMPAAIDSLRISTPSSVPVAQSEDELSQVAIQSVVNALVSQSEGRSKSRVVPQPTTATTSNSLKNEVAVSEETVAASLPDRSSTKTVTPPPGADRATLIAQAPSDAGKEFIARPTPTRQKLGGQAASLGDFARVSLPSGDVRQGNVLQTFANLSPGAVTATPEGEVMLTIERPVSSPNWSTDFTQRVTWAVNARVPSAQISLNPEHLGPVELLIEVEDQQTRIQFNATHGVTREAIEQSLPRLREALEQQGLTLEQADVGDFTRGGQETDDQEAVANNTPTNDKLDQAGDADDVVESTVRSVEGLVDTFV